MFQFPASPAVGDVVNGYRYNGVGWAGGPLVGTPTNQFFDASGLVTVDIPVPTWAKHARITGRAWTGAAQYVCMRLSADGTTFPSGASDYVDGGVLMNSGTGLYQAQNTVVANAMTLTQSGDASSNTPQMIDTDINVWRPTAGQYYEAKHYGRSFLNSASAGHRGWVGASYHGTAALFAGTQLKTLRILNGIGGVAFGAGSFFNVEWMAAAADIPQSNAVGDAPSDGAEYVRINGVWRLKYQTFDLSGLSTQDIAVPSWARHLHIDGAIFTNNAAAHPALQCSTDGTTFLAGTNYTVVGGPYHNTSPSPYYGTQGQITAPAFYLGYPRTNLGVPQNFQFDMNIVAGASQVANGRTYSVAYDGTGFAWTMTWQGWLGVAAPYTIKKVRILNMPTAPVAMAANSYAVVRWS